MKKIRIMILDVDGTLTDGKIYMGADGEVFKVFNIKDGSGIHDILPQYGIVPVIITGRTSPIVQRRCVELGINYCFQGCRDKVSAIKAIANEFQLNASENGVFEELSYIGDDIIDLDAMKYARITGCPKDAVMEVKETADYVCKNAGGNGAVREFIEWICKNFAEKVSDGVG